MKDVHVLERAMPATTLASVPAHPAVHPRRRRQASFVGGGLLATVCAVVTFVSACTQPYGSRHWPQSREDRPQLIFNVDVDFHDAAHFWDAPWPADARRTATGTPDVQGMPNPYNVSFVELSKVSVQNDVDANGAGFSPLPVISFHFDRVPPPMKVIPLTTTSSTSGLQLVDLTPGRVGERVAVDHHITPRSDVARPAGLLQMAPLTGLSLQPGTWAAIVQRDVDSDGAHDLNASPVMNALLSGTHPNAAWQETFDPLRSNLSAIGVRADSIAAATVFTVADPTARLTRFMDEARRGPAPKLVSMVRGREVVNTEAAALVELQGVVQQPQHQSGEPPHFTETGAFVVDVDGRLQTTRLEDAPFILTIPKGKMPATGFPIYLYVHGTGGHATQAIDRGARARPGAPPTPGSGLASWLAPHGVATACVAGPYSPDRIAERALDGYGAYVFMNPPAMRDNFGQMLIEHARFVRLLEEVRIDASLVPEVDASAAADGKIRFDLKRSLVGGHSLGSYLSGMIAGTLDDFDGAVLSGAGGTWVEFAFGPKDPIDLQGVIETVALPPGEDLDHFHPFIDVFEAAVAAADNTLYTPAAFCASPVQGNRRPMCSSSRASPTPRCPPCCSGPWCAPSASTSSATTSAAPAAIVCCRRCTALAAAPLSRR